MSISFFAEEDQIEQVPVPHEKILDCMTACIHVANIKDTLEQRKNLMHVLTTALSSGFPWTGTLLWPTFFFSLIVFTRLLVLVPLVIEFLWQSKYRPFH